MLLSGQGEDHLQLGSSGEFGARYSKERPSAPELAGSPGVWDALAELSLHVYNTPDCWHRK